MRILVTYAMQGEFVELKFPGMMGGEEVEIGYLRTGIGKVKSTFYLSEAIRNGQPDLVINMGAAGSVKHRVGDIFVCRRFIDRDMKQLSELDVEYQLDSSALLAEKGYCTHWTEEGTCSTGDTFLTEPTGFEEDVADMEAYAQAFACNVGKVPFIAVKYVTDIVGRNSTEDCIVRLAEARAGLDSFFNDLKKGI